MHKLKKETKRLLYPYEVLRARFDIRDFFLNTIVRQVYENSGQTLSLVKMQLDMEQFSLHQRVESKISTGKLLEETIKGLRRMCKSFYPDKNMLVEQGFTGLLQFASGKIFPNSTHELVVPDESFQLPEGVQLITLKIILDVLISIQESGGELQKTEIVSNHHQISFIISYLSEATVPLNKNPGQDYPYLSFYERVELIGGNIDQRTLKTGNHQFLLQLSKNSFTYE